MLWTMCIGFLLEFVGFGVAAFGSWQTWKANADERPFFSARIRKAGNWIRVEVFRRRPRTHQVTGSASGSSTVHGDAAGYVSQTLTDAMTLETKIEAVQANALKALAAAAEAHRVAVEEKRERKTAMAVLEKQIHGTQQELSKFARGLVVDGVPLTVTGLTFAVFGLVLQAVASIATFNGGS